MEGVPAGFVEINSADLPEAVDIAYFGIMPEFIGRKLGPWFLNWALEQACNRPKMVNTQADFRRKMRILPSIRLSPGCHLYLEKRYACGTRHEK